MMLFPKRKMNKPSSILQLALLFQKIEKIRYLKRFTRGPAYNSRALKIRFLSLACNCEALYSEENNCFSVPLFIESKRVGVRLIYFR